MGARAIKQDICKHFNINKLLLSRNTVLHPFQIEIKKTTNRCELIYELFYFFCFSTIFPSEKVTLDSFVVAAATAPVSGFGGLS